MRFSPTEQLFLACAGTAGSKERIQSLLEFEIDWERLLQLAQKHQILPLLYHNLRGCSVPEEWKNRFEQIYLANLARNLKIEQEQGEIFALLQERAIDFVPLKGVFWAELVYGNLALRQTSDIDFLVREEDLFKARDLLAGHGFAYNSKDEAAQLARDHHLVLTRKGLPSLELHWNIFPDRSVEAPSKYLWQETEKIHFKNQEMLFFTPEMMVVHAVTKFCDSCGISLKYLVDFAETLLLYENIIDWGKLYKLAKTFRMYNSYFLCCRLMKELLKKETRQFAAEQQKISFFLEARINNFPKAALVKGEKTNLLWLRVLYLDRFSDALRGAKLFFFPHPDRR